VAIDSMAWLVAAGMDWVQAQSLPNMVFFREINSFLDDEIGEFAGNLLGRMVAVAGSAALTLLTLWILVQGYRIATGLSREPMMVLVGDALKAVLIIGIATGAAAGAGSTYRVLTDGLGETVAQVVTGREGSAYEDIDKALAIMQVALQVIDAIDHGGDVLTEQRKSRAMWFTGVGLGGPAIIAAGMLLLNKVAMALVVGLGPIFILCLLFRATRQLFSKWLYYGLGTLFSLALLTVMVTLAMDMLIAVGLAFWVADLLGAPGTQESLSAMAMQQGGMGIILTMLIVSAPPMAAMFFNGVLGQFSPYNAVGVATGGGGAPPPGSGLPPGVAGRSG
jgi:type IV secretion system protein VirB6